MRISIGSDHAGYRYKELLKTYLQGKGIDVVDFGTSSAEPCDYPDSILPVAKTVASHQVDRGIVLGHSGNGEAMMANRVRGVRCRLCWNVESAELARKHNDANVLSLGQHFIPESQLFDIVDTWLKTPFENGRHVRRIEKLDTLISN